MTGRPLPSSDLKGEKVARGDADGTPLKSTPSEEVLQFGFLLEDVGFQVHQTRRAVRMAMRPSAQIASKPRPSGSLTTLILIGLNPGVSQNQLADALFLDSSKVASLVGQLEQDALVEKRPSAIDRRRHDLFLTDEGDALLATIRTKDDARSRMLSNGLDAGDRAQLVELLVRFQDAIRAR